MEWAACLRCAVALLVIGAFSLSAQDESSAPSAAPPGNPQQQSPKDEKKGNANPAEATGQKTKNVTIQAAEATKKLGQATFAKVRDWEDSWLTGPYVGKDRELVPMTAKQRRDIYLQQTLTTPSAYLKLMFVAGIDQWRDSPPQWGQGWDAYGARYGSREGQYIAASTLSTLGNAALRYEPRYDQCKCSGFRLRTRHAILRNFLTYNQSERELRPQWALYGGAFGGGLISTAWKPHPRNAFAEGGRTVLVQAGFGVLANFLTEFAGDINRKLGAKR